MIRDHPVLNINHTPTKNGGRFFVIFSIASNLASQFNEVLPIDFISA